MSVAVAQVPKCDKLFTQSTQRSGVLAARVVKAEATQAGQLDSRHQSGETESIKSYYRKTGELET